MSDRHAPDAASRYDDPEAWVSGGHEKFETPIHAAAPVPRELTILPRRERVAELRLACAIAHGHCSGLSEAALTTLILEEGLPSRAERERMRDEAGGTTPPHSPS